MRRASTPGLKFLRAAMLMALIPMAVTAVHAQTQRSGGGGESQKILQQYQQLAAEKTALQAEVAQLKKNLESAQTELAAAQKERDALKGRSKVSAAAAAQLARANESKQSAEKSLEQNKQRTQELVDRFKLTIGTLKGVESERAQLQKDYNALNAAMDKCASDNLDLYDISNTVLDRYEHVGLFTRVGTAEPFTRITRTRIDNLVIEYRARAATLRVKKPATP
jgi:Skp family chaperone for outer membrane proteins